MIERAIENWLTKTNERNFKIPFCQALAREGHTLIYISSDRPMEQGKDLITVAPNGDICAYQLKTGDIGVNQWRAVRPQIDELIQIPIVHPNIDKTKPYKSFLVLNGGISDEVRLQITQMNEANIIRSRGDSNLEVIERSQLLKTLHDAQGRFVPHKLTDFKSFLELFLASGKEQLDKAKFFSFLNNTLFSEFPRQKADALNAISSSVILTAYAMSEFEQEKNHFAIFEAWTALGASIVRYAERAKLDQREWQASLDLVMLGIAQALDSLEDDALAKETWIEGYALGDGGDVYRARTTLVIGALAARALDRFESEEHGFVDRNVLDLIRKHQQFFWIWGESAFPSFFMIVKFLEAIGENRLAVEILEACLEAVLERNHPRRDDALPSPYYSATEVLEKNLGLAQEPNGQESSGSSYTLKPLISALARRKRRGLLTKHWRRISHIRFKEFIVDTPEDWLLWHAETGTNQSRFPSATQSWTEMSRQAEREASGCAAFLSAHRSLLRAFTLVAPHRISDSVISFLDAPVVVANQTA